MTPCSLCGTPHDRMQGGKRPRPQSYCRPCANDIERERRYEIRLLGCRAIAAKWQYLADKYAPERT